jgi:hypothetical protein
LEESLQIDQTVTPISSHEPDLEGGGDILTEAIQCQQMVGSSSEEDGAEEQGWKSRLWGQRRRSLLNLNISA